MDRKDRFSLWLAVFGTFFELAPIIAALILSTIFLIQNGFFQIDFLIPAELLPLVLVGAGLLIWAAIRAHSRSALIIISFIAGMVFLFGGQIGAVATGIASGTTEPTGFLFGVLIGTVIAFDLAVIVTGVGGILLSLDLFKRTMPQNLDKP